ncbi:TerC/Alx family metal homeostasis membrane protein [Rahnella sp. C60]|uniref:TerC/Alx family metal homeostasis membrane protein n=1 Tax=Rahnella perminowiae TaxID=2816244 RepID=A0ABS6L2V4_9GAMM|nr:TerC/Alx family metal homeostasis membrane protein [Rahnella perminowiae]UJD89468.1 TerC/Alx family metal homeostasis membrane protein [Rahnella aquatilis]MBU9810825.1 TerC/Alx family metal homeostasis membrane protein [Rahnella perminowiae]MBU9817527.1 TerC/Alx family metal homeostasis membrane protein [Rahnella perminowiae]MBU9836180.1 TerC/Alx family metal homeostasis membrane protein [Rahnella perminowiae]MCR9001336.1 TerC/Alx family metal homeostasis membrane protein [Rahnella perminow
MQSDSLGFPFETTIVFIVVAVAALLTDIFAHRSHKPIGLISASLWTVFWIAVSLSFAGFLYIHHGKEVASLFLTGYALEQVLSIDNLFVIMAIFAWFKVPDGYRHRILYWGVIGAIVFRGIFVVIGTGLLALGPWVEMVFAVVILWTAILMMRAGKDDEETDDYSDHIANRLVRRFFPVFPKLVGPHFLVSSEQVEAELAKPENQGFSFTVKKGMRYATPLLLCIAVVEISDLMFAFDSVPAVIAVSREPLIVYSAMMFAVLGLRTMYFVLEALRKYLVHLEKSVIFLLFFVAAKLALNASNHLWHHGIEISALASLYVVLGVLALGIIASLLFPGKKDAV